MLSFFICCPSTTSVFRFKLFYVPKAGLEQNQLHTKMAQQNGLIFTFNRVTNTCTTALASSLKLLFFMPHTKNSQPKISQHMIQPQLPLLHHHHLTITANPTSLFGVIIVISGVSNCGPPQWPSLRYLASSYS